MVKTLQKKFILTAMIAISLLLFISLGAINGFNLYRIQNEVNNTLSMLVENDGVRPGDQQENMGEPGIPTQTDALPTDGSVNPSQAGSTEDPADGAKNAPQADGTEEPTDGAPSIPQTDGSTAPPQADSTENNTASDGKDDQPPEAKRPSLFNPQISEDMAMAARYFLVRFDTDGQIVYTDVSNISSVDEDAANTYAEEAYASGDTTGRMENFRFARGESSDGQGTILVFLNVSSNRQSVLAVLLISTLIGVIGWALMLLLVVLLSKRAIRPIAENLEKQKQFVTDAGHEIKTPLAIILANTDAMELHNGETKWSKNIRKQTIRLSGLMKNLLTLARMDEQSVPTVMTDLNISALAEETAESFQESAKLKEIDLKVQIRDRMKLHANREEMTQLFTILLDNAVKYSPEHGEILFSLDKSGKGVIIRCENTCENLPAVDADRLFDRFYRSDTARTQKSGGYGIGLSVARAITEKHKGRIRAEYKGEDRIVFTALF